MWLVVASVLFRASTNHVTTTSANITFLVLAPYGQFGERAEPIWKAGPAVIPSVRLAVDRINNRSDVLPGYHVRLLEGNSGCQHGPRTAYGFVSSILLDGGASLSSNVVGVIGPACSESAKFLGTLGAKDSISLIQISPAATSPLLTDTVRYRNTFRTLSTSLQHIGALAQLMTLNSWENVAVLYDQSRHYFRQASELFISSHSSNIGFDSAIDSTHYPLGSIEARHKVIFLIAGSQLAREVICLAYLHRPKIIYPVYQWLIVDQSKSELSRSISFRHNGRVCNCTHEVMIEALEGTVITSYQFINRENNGNPTDVDLTPEQYQELYPHYLEKHLEELNHNDRDTSYQMDAEEYAVSYHDATWALTLALNASLDILQPNTLTDYGFGQPEITEVIRQQLGRLEFEGLMGKVAFQSTTHDSITPLEINQCIRGENTLVGVYNGATLRIVAKEAKFVADIFHQEDIGVHPAVTAIFFASTIILTLYTICLHTIYIVFHNHKSIKAASFTISHFMFSGCYLILLQAFTIIAGYSYNWQSKTSAELHNRDIAFGVICNTNEWLNCIGISLILSTLCGKLWRIYRLFNYFNTKSYLISDLTLTAFIVVVVGVNVVLLVVWTAVDPLLAVFEQQDIDYDGEGEPVLLVRGSCYCKYYTLWISTTDSVLFLVLTAVVVLSSLNRRISRRFFQTAKSVNLMVYMIAPPCLLGNALAFLIQSLDVHYTYIFRQISLLSVVCFVCVFMFTPPAYSAVWLSITPAPPT